MYIYIYEYYSSQYTSLFQILCLPKYHFFYLVNDCI